MMPFKSGGILGSGIQTHKSDKQKNIMIYALSLNENEPTNVFLSKYVCVAISKMQFRTTTNNPSLSHISNNFIVKMFLRNTLFGKI